MSVLSALRDCISSGGHPHVDGDIVHLLPGVTLPRKSATSWRYRKGGYLDLESLVFFLDNERLVLSQYVKAATAADVQIIPFAERKPLLEYLRGGGGQARDSAAYHEIDQEREQRQAARTERRASASGAASLNITPRTTPTLSARTLRRLSVDLSQPSSRVGSRPSSPTKPNATSTAATARSQSAAVRIGGWVWWWLLLSTLVQLVDAAFLLLRPHSLPGGSLHHYFAAYATYLQYDPAYADTADPFIHALLATEAGQIAANVATLALITFAPRLVSTALAAMVAVCVSAGVLCITVFFFVYEAVCSSSGSHGGGVAGEVAKHRYLLVDLSTWDWGYALSYVLTTSLWIVFPLAIIVSLGGQLVRAADRAGASSVSKSKKE